MAKDALLEVDGVAYRLSPLAVRGRRAALSCEPPPGAPIPDYARRVRIRALHRSTLLLHAALRNQLCGHVTQKCSLVAEDRFRFYRLLLGQLAGDRHRMPVAAQ